jgi:hypothetical protein
MPQLSVVLETVQVLANVAIVGTFFIYWLLWRAALRQLAHMSHQARANSREHAWRGLFEHFATINNYINTQQDAVAPPYPQLTSGQANGVLLFHHLNLIFRFHVSKELLTQEECDGFNRWIEVVFFKWVEQNRSLGSDLQAILDFGDLYPKSFLTWLREHPSYVRVARDGRRA